MAKNPNLGLQNAETEALLLAEAAKSETSRGTARKLDLRLRRVQKAAYFRSRGQTWDEIAELVGWKKGKSAMDLCHRDKSLWARMMREATDELLAEEIEPEAIKNQRELMALKDSTDLREKDIAVRSADSILRYLAKVRPQQLELTLKKGEVSDEELIEKLKASANAAAQRAAQAEVLDAEVVPPAALLPEPESADE